MKHLNVTQPFEALVVGSNCFITRLPDSGNINVKKESFQSILLKAAIQLNNLEA
jgi:hypothetical protein